MSPGKLEVRLRDARGSGQRLATSTGECIGERETRMPLTGSDGGLQAERELIDGARVGVTLKTLIDTVIPVSLPRVARKNQCAE